MEAGMCVYWPVLSVFPDLSCLCGVCDVGLCSLKIPRNMRLMYVHSWQSYIWNKLISWRLQTFGSSPMAGDIVRRSSTAGNTQPDIEFLSEETKSNYSVHDILFPLPGYDVQLPKNSVKDEYARLLSLEGISVDQLKHRVKCVFLFSWLV